MLKINKILSKKIQFPLSLLGLFPFCHSRESGNPSFLSLRGVKQQSNLNHNGFSLIELMIAITILALAIFGIFHAYSVGFLGMADTRDRTVATNYAREAMEDVKNMDFELVTNENLGTAESVGEKFTRVISVNTENGNLKEITTLVYWNNRNGKTINVETSMYINRTLFNPGEAAYIVLYADPYYTVFPTAGTANIIAVIKDIKGNTKIDWNGADIQFSITSASDLPKSGGGSFLGYFVDNPGDTAGSDTKNVPPDGGIARTIFKASGYEITVDGVLQLAQGDVVIEASVDLPNGGGTISDAITIVVTLDVVRIELLADPYSIDADGTSISTVTATLVNSGGAPVEDASNEITFNISGEGIFVDSEGSPLGVTTVPMVPSEGTATIYVMSINDTPGVATVTASSEGLLSGTVNIKTTGQPENISVSINPDLIYMDGTAEVIVVIRDINGVPVDFTGTINLNVVTETSTGDGSFNPISIIFNGTTSTETSIFTPISFGNVTIRASDASEILNEGAADITISEVLVASKITVSTIPQNIKAGGTKTSTITAKVKTEDDIIVSTYVEPITFETTLGYFSNDTSTITLTIDNPDYENGIANVELFPSDTLGIATITVSSSSLTSGSVEVGFYSGEHHIELIAVPSKMLVNGDTCEVTATVVDEGGTPVDTYNEDITFTILVGWPKIAKFIVTGTSSLTKTLINGKITVDLISQSTAGTVTLKASSFTGITDITGYLNIPVDINFLDLTDPLNITYDDVLKKLSFDIEVQGTEIILEQMQVSWSDNIASEILNKIDIGIYEVYSNGDGVASGTVVDIIPTNLLTDTYTINLYFNSVEAMSGKTYNIIFNPSSGNYSVEFDVP